MMNNVKRIVKRFPIIRRLEYGSQLYSYYKNEYPKESKAQFLARNIHRIRLFNQHHGKYQQISKLICKVNICAAPNSSFFYSIDPYKYVVMKNQILDNTSIDYTWVIKSSFDTVIGTIKGSSAFLENNKSLINAFRRYVNSARKNHFISHKYSACLDEIESIFIRPAEHFHEAIQRILFVNQWLWQTAHKHNGFGHLDWILYELYKKDIDSGFITKKMAKKILEDFFLVLHDKCWYKSTLLLGDTGQIVILGGLSKDGVYKCNELTYLFIEVAKQLRLPDPKVLLRVSSTTPDDLIYLAIECISTGIGAPLISNDDSVIPALIQFGYDEDDAYNYATSACWEPLVVGKSCDQNNIQTLNICKPFVDFLGSSEFESCEGIVDVKNGYLEYLRDYINQLLTKLDEKVFEEDPLLTLFTPDVLCQGNDVVHGGAKYANLGLTTVGLASVVNSLLNIERIVFVEKEYSLHDLNVIRIDNYDGQEPLRKKLDKYSSSFGKDEKKVIDLTNEILFFISGEFHKHHTKLGGKYKFGLSSPNYIVDARLIGATFDGRKSGMPFSTHISGKNGLAPTELICFASQIDYGDNRINGNVLDFVLPSGFLRYNMKKAATMIIGGIRQGFYQLQINVLDSRTLIEAQKNPERYSDLVVRVWGFSAYFKDIPKEYQDNLIRRAIEAELSFSV